MKEISVTKRMKVIKLFLSGLSYDDIAQQTGISKGSVVNIIDEFREGKLPIPPDMTEYVDALRQVAVDIRKNNTSIAQVLSCAKIYTRIRELGVNSEQIEQWLDICRDIATPTISNDRFVAAALELARLETENGLSYGDVITDYNTKLNKSLELDRETIKKSKQFDEIMLKHEQEKERAIIELESITRATATAQEMFDKQKNDLKSRLDEYLAQNKLSWKKVNIAISLFETEINKKNLTKREMDQLSERIQHAVSLLKTINHLEQEKDRLQSEVAELKREEACLNTNVNTLRVVCQDFNKSISEDIKKSTKVIKTLKAKRAELEELEQTTSKYTHNLYLSRLILDFLFSPDSLNNYDLDKLVSLMIALRQERLGIGLKQAKDASGNIICECQIPRMNSTVKLSEKEIDDVRILFARLLTPMVKDKFVSRFDYDLAELKHSKSKDLAVIKATLEERNRHPF